jgi:hypothetical protein
MKATLKLISVASIALGTLTAAGQSAGFSQPQTHASQLNESGQVLFSGRSTPYLIRRLPVSSFPDLPDPVQENLNQRGCLIPQTYEAHQPENVIRARFERPGSLDWAVLCSVQGTVSLLVFFSSSPDKPFVLASAPETQRLQAHGSSATLGFNWGIDPATPNQVHQAQAGLAHPAQWVDHDAVADSVVDHRTVYHFYAKDAWSLLEMPQ